MASTLVSISIDRLNLLVSVVSVVVPAAPVVEGAATASLLLLVVPSVSVRTTAADGAHCFLRMVRLGTLIHGGRLACIHGGHRATCHEVCQTRAFIRCMDMQLWGLVYESGMHPAESYSNQACGRV